MSAPLDLDALKAQAEELHFGNSAEIDAAETILALIERVKAAEAEAERFRTLWDKHGKNDLLARAEAAEARLAAVLALADEWKHPGEVSVLRKVAGPRLRAAIEQGKAGRA